MYWTERRKTAPRTLTTAGEAIDDRIQDSINEVSVILQTLESNGGDGADDDSDRESSPGSVTDLSDDDDE